MPNSLLTRFFSIIKFFDFFYVVFLTWQSNHPPLKK
jgi:hypothetical protein